MLSDSENSVIFREVLKYAIQRWITMLIVNFHVSCRVPCTDHFHMVHLKWGTCLIVNEFQSKITFLNPLSPEGGWIFTPLEKTCFSKADFSDLLKEVLKAVSTSEWPLILAIYWYKKLSFLRPFRMICRQFP